MVARAPATVVMMGTLYASASRRRFLPSMTSGSSPAQQQEDSACTVANAPRRAAAGSSRGARRCSHALHREQPRGSCCGPVLAQQQTLCLQQSAAPARWVAGWVPMAWPLE